ncbi:MAG: N-acetylmuramoyl-L-alanine amidase [Phycisphaerae bacterium]
MHRLRQNRAGVRRTVNYVWLVGGLIGMFAAGGVFGWSLRARTATPAVPLARPVADPLATPATGYSWSDLPDPTFPVPAYARFLAGATVVLDPGHVGQNLKGKSPNFKRGPTGLREATANLNVALYLREFLTAAGATVVLTREEDRSLDLTDAEDLRARAAVANQHRADLFISLHHNASDTTTTNFSSLWYHKSPDQSKASLAAARYLLTGLNDALRLENQLECPILSDELLYADGGLAVLRHARVPAVLVESSFHSNPLEEQRLKDPVYNRREAYGLFLGLARWAQAGLPRVRVLEPAEGRVRPGEKIVIALDDGLSGRGGWGQEKVKVLADSIVVKLDDKPVEFSADLLRDRLTLTVPADTAASARTLYVNFSNIFGNWVIHPALAIEVAPGAPTRPAPTQAAPKPSRRSRRGS